MMNSIFKSKALWQPIGACAMTAALVFSMSGCNGCGANTQAPIVSSNNGPDPAAANEAPVDGSAPAVYPVAGQPTRQPVRVAGTSQSYTPQQNGESYPTGQQAPAPIVQGNASQNEAYNYNQQQPAYDNGQGYEQGYADGEAVVQADQAPPPLPQYDQPPAPAEDDLWTPGYWGYANTGYYWVPGAWVTAPYYGALWTPPFWGWYGGHYRFHRGYWGPHVGFYGGINYGYGYVGTGYYGGYWNNNHFYYNRAVTRVSPRITNVYERNVVVNNVHYTSVTNNRVSYNGGRGGIDARPRPYEVAAMREQHVGPLPAQQQLHQQAAANRANFFDQNHGRPAEAAINHPIQVQHIAAPAGAVRGGFGGRPGEPNNNPALMQQQHNPQEFQRNQADQQRNLQMQHNQVEQQRGLMMQQRTNAQAQQRNFQQQQQLQHNNVADQQKNLQLQQHNQELQRNQAEQQRNLQMQQHNNAQEQQRNFQQQQQLQHNNAMEQQRNLQLQLHNNGLDQQQQHNNAIEAQRNIQNQQRVNETAQRDALAQQHQQQQVEQQRVQQQAQFQQQQQQRNALIEQQRNAQDLQRNQQIQQQPQQQAVQHQQQMQAQQQHMEQQRSFQQQQQPRVEQPHVQAQPHFEQRAAPTPHVEVPRAAPALHPAGGGGGGHPGPHH